MSSNDAIYRGINFGSLIAIIISVIKWKSIGWAIVHGLLGWIYVIYYIVVYGWSLG